MCAKISAFSLALMCHVVHISHHLKLTTESLVVVGYHSSCYKKVTALPKKYTEDFSNFMANLVEPSLASTSSHCPERVLDSPTAISNREVSPKSSGVEEKSAELTETPDSLDQIASIPEPEVPPKSSGVEEKSAESTDTHDSLHQPSADPEHEVPCASITVNQKSSDATATTFPSRSSTCNKQATCLFCNCKQKRSGNTMLKLMFPLCEDSIQQIKAMARSLDDSQILSKLDNQTVAYHRVCYAAYQKKERRSTEDSVDSIWHQFRRLHKLAYESLSNFITREIIENSKVMYFSQLFSRYQALLLEFGEYKIKYEDITDYRPDILEKKIKKYFGDRIRIEASTGPRCKKIVYKTDIDVSLMANNTKLLETQDENRLQNVAYDLRNCVKNIDRKPLPSVLSAKDVIRGECVIPKTLLKFIRNLISGPHISNDDSDETTVQIASICSDIIYAITKRRTKPAAVKSLTNSRQVVTILNRYGHTIGYNLAEELKTEMTYTSVGNDKIIPTGIDTGAGRSTHIAFDNFDRFVDTTSGKVEGPTSLSLPINDHEEEYRPADEMKPTTFTSFHVNENTDEIESITSIPLMDDATEECQPTARKRRRFEQITRELRSYYAKPTESSNCSV